MTRTVRALRPVFLLLLTCAVADAQSLVRYTVTLSQPAAHIVHVQMDLPAGAPERELQMPVWNAHYQVRDFSQFINWITASGDHGQLLPLAQLDKSRWRVSGAENGVHVEYEIFANESGPYNAQLNEHHAFFNLAEILMFSIDARNSPIRVRFANIPRNWKTAIALPSEDDEFLAQNYDRLVDSPVEISPFAEADFDEGGGHYRVIIDADPADYDRDKLVAQIRKIVATETAWMKDRPFDTYLFFYHFPKQPGGGGMEHAYSTAIDVNAKHLADDPLAFPGVTAHEFFHLWNVKRIRPQSLEPVDYSRENYTTALWFSEGVTDTVQNIALLRTGMLNESQYLARLAATFEEIENSPANDRQSAEDSSRDAWLEKYSYYRQPQRSISYYHKGDLLGVMLDLTIREATHGQSSLRDVFLAMNEDAKQGRFFSDSEGVRKAAEVIAHTNLEDFFKKYVSGTEKLPTEQLFHTVGLRLSREVKPIPTLGFAIIQTFGQPPAVSSIASGSPAEQEGLRVGESVLTINGRAVGASFYEIVEGLHPDETVHVRVRGANGERELHWKVGARDALQYEFKELQDVTPEQKSRRAAWLKGESEAR